MDQALHISYTFTLDDDDTDEDGDKEDDEDNETGLRDSSLLTFYLTDSL